VSTDAHGHVIPFKGPDGIVEGWVDFGAGRFKVTAVDSGAFVTPTVGDGRYNRQSGLPVDGANATGVDNTGVTECAAAIQAVLNANAGTSTGPAGTVRLYGTFNIASTLIVKGNVDASGATFNYSGSGTAVQVGAPALGYTMTGCDIKLGRIYCTSKPGTGWVAGTVGLNVQNVFRSKIDALLIQGFETGLLTEGDASYSFGGCAYNVFTIPALNNNKINHKLYGRNGSTPGTGFCNQNIFNITSMSHAGTESGTGTRHILAGLAGTAISINNNTWVNTSLEGSIEEQTIECNGTDNTWVAPRFEFTGTGSKAHVLWNERAARNWFVGGYNSTSLSEVTVAGGVPANIAGGNGNRMITQTGGGLILEAQAGGSTAALTIMAANGNANNVDPTTGYAARFGPSLMRFKTQADTNDRFFYSSAVSNLINMGPGNAATDTTFGRLAAKVFGVGTDNVIRSGLNATASRPTPAAAGAGSMFYDTTLSKPIWSDGTTWRDATGTAV
jgi:hypothetical protein